MMFEATTLYMIRHGRLVNSKSDIFTGQSDVPLSEDGEVETVSYLNLFKEKKISVVISSDLKRTLEPAKVYSKTLGCPLIVKKDLREINAGDWENKSYNDVIKTEGLYLQKRYADPVNLPFPNGESILDLKNRVIEAFNPLLADNFGKNILLIGHAGVIRIIVLSYLNIPLSHFFKFEVEYGSLSVIRFFKDGNVTLKLFNFKELKDV